MLKTYRNLGTILFALLTFASAALAGELEETFDKTYPLKQGHRFSLKNVNGSVEISGWDREEVHVVAVKKVTAAGRERAEELMREIEIIVTESGGDIAVETKLPRKNSGGFLSWFFDGMQHASYSVRYTITLPHRVISSIKSVNGAINLADCSGEIELRTTNGKVEVRRASGEVSASTTNGSIAVELTEVKSQADLDFSTTNGSIVLSLPEDFGGEISARTTNGSIVSDFPIEVVGEFSKRHLRGRIGDGSNRCNLKTTNGSIKIRK